MKILATLCILVIGVPAVIGICLYPPINNLMSACKVRNLTVYDTHRNLLTNDASCNNTLSKWSYNLDSPFMVNFTFPLNREYKNSTFLLTVVDRTVHQLLWMVANITAVGTSLTPLSKYTKATTLKYFQSPVFNSTHREHHIEFLVFQQKSVFPIYSQQIQPFMQPFHLPTWIDNQYRLAGVVFCGPVAGAYLRLNDHVYTYPTQPNYKPSRQLYPTLPPSHNNGNLYPSLGPIHNGHNGQQQYSNSNKKSSGSRLTLKFEKVLIVAGVLSFLLF